MFVGVAVCELHLPGVRSLKEKRKVVKSLVERIYHRHRVSVTETAYHDLHQRAEISMALIGNGYGEVENHLEDLRRVFDGEPEAFVTAWDPRVLEEAR
ncbi:MAG: DUF503 domain-containing protein [Acidobacteria bacterium]|nr:DUF503 domain-containing protein [Acidobacteriota bacterium]